jgi:RimJ/RimL family protein N-acetyltransferase
MAEIVITTERLILRTWDESDLDAFMEATNTPAVMRWLGGVWSREDHEAGFARITGYQRDFGHTFWIVEDRASGELLGFCGLKRVNSPGAGDLTGTAEVGWRLRESAWGKGIAKEAAIASLDLAFGRFSYSEVVAITVEGNGASQGLMRRLGMQRRADLDYIDPRHVDDLGAALVWSIAAGDWPEARAAALA